MTATTTLIGNTTSDFELRYTANGRAVANGTIAVSDRTFDRQKNEWVDGDTWFARVTLWAELAEHAAASIPKGTRVVASGRIGQRDWEDKDGSKRTSVEVTVDDIGASVKYATLQVTRTPRDVGNGRQTGVQGQPQGDSWGTQAYGSDAEVPF